MDYTTLTALVACLICLAVGLIAGMSMQWRRDSKYIVELEAKLSDKPPPSAALIYTREPTPDEVAYGLELESQLIVDEQLMQPPKGNDMYDQAILRYSGSLQ